MPGGYQRPRVNSHFTASHISHLFAAIFPIPLIVMAPLYEQAQLAKNVMGYMGHIAEQKSSRQDKKLARSAELKKFLIYLSQRAPKEMDRLLKFVSPKCEAALRVEKESRIGGKRTEPPNRNQSNPKRLKFTCATEEVTTSQTAMDDEEDIPMKHEAPNAQCESQSSEIGLPHTSNLTSERNEEGMDEITEKEAPSTTSAENRLSSVAVTCPSEEANPIATPTAYQIEFGLSSGSPNIANYVSLSLFTLEPSTTRPTSSIHAEVAKIWKIILVLDFFKTRRELHQYLENREKMPGEKLQARTDWELSDPSDILDTLDHVKRNTIDNKIHRAYGQTMLFLSVNAQVAAGYKPTITGHRSDHTGLLEELALKRAGPVSKTEVDQTIASYFYEYYAGQKWLAVMDWFGGSGIVMVFVVAGKHI